MLGGAHGISRYTRVEIVGDLRDFGDIDDVNKVLEWFTRVVSTYKERNLAVVRQAVLHVQVEFGGDSILCWNGETMVSMTSEAKREVKAE